jgi:anti-sigma factor RsiW
MHDYLDGDLSSEQEVLFHTHLEECPACKQHFDELQETVSFLKQAKPINAPADFTEQLMAKLPPVEKKKKRNIIWMKQHPLIAAASVFIILMAGSLFSIWNGNDKLQYTHTTGLIVNDQTIVIPKGKVVNGDLMVKNGNVRIEGTVQGNVTVVNGKAYMASTDQVTGKVEVINEAFKWLWFKIKEGYHSIVDSFSGEPAVQ